MKPLWAHQAEAVHRAKDTDCYALFFEQGCGKSRAFLTTQQGKCKQERRPLRTLILCPPIVVDNWKREFLAYSEVPEKDILCLRGSGKQRVTSINQFGGTVVVTNYESLNMPEVLAGLLNWKPEVLALDESQKCKDLSSKRTKHAVKLSQFAKYRYILSGTPFVNSPFDVFSQFLILDQGRTFGADFREFRRTYFIDENAGRPKQNYFPAWVPKLGALEAINEKINSSCMRVKKSECLDLPPLVRQVVEVELDGDQRRAYRAMESESVATICDGRVASADLVLKQGLRLQQIASGFLKLDDGSVKLFDSNPKCEALRELLGTIPDTAKVIIWCVFRRDYDEIRKLLHRLAIKCVEIHGGTPENIKTRNVDDFNSPTSATRVLFGHPASAGIGINLTAASYAIFYSRSFSLEQDLQAEARNYRGGSEIHEKITRIDIVAKDTIDEVICEALAAKQDVAEILLKTLKEKQCKK